MLLNVTANLSYAAPQQCDALLQIEPTNDGGQRCIDPVLTLLSGTTVGQQQGEDSIGLRRWLSVDTHLECQFTAQVEVGRPNVDFATLAETPKDKLATAVIPYLMPSRYCQSDLFLDFTASQFGTLSGGTCVQAMNDWVGGKLHL